MPDQLRASFRLSRDPDDIGRARRWMAETLTEELEVPPERLDALLLAVSELTTNVLVHTECRPTVTLRGGEGRVRVEVHDDDPRAPQLQPFEPRMPGGNGLRIVDAYTDAWGVEHLPADGKVVWFVCTFR